MGLECVSCSVVNWISCTPIVCEELAVCGRCWVICQKCCKNTSNQKATGLLKSPELSEGTKAWRLKWIGTFYWNRAWGCGSTISNAWSWRGRQAEGIGKCLAKKDPFHQSDLDSCWDKVYLHLRLRLSEFLKLMKQALSGIIHISWGEIRSHFRSFMHLDRTQRNVEEKRPSYSRSSYPITVTHILTCPDIWTLVILRASHLTCTTIAFAWIFFLP